MREEKLPLESEFLLFKIIMEVNGMTPKDLANFYVETAFNSRSKLKLSKYGIYGIDFPTKENLNRDIDEFNESEELEDEKTDSQDFLSDVLMSIKIIIRKIIMKMMMIQKINLKRMILMIFALFK